MSIQQVKNALGNLWIFPFTISQFSRTSLILCQITFHKHYWGFFPPWTYFLSWFRQPNREAEQDRKDLLFPSQNKITAPPDSQTFSSQWFVQTSFFFPEENLGDVALVVRGRKSSAHLPFLCLTGAHNRWILATFLCTYISSAWKPVKM